MHIYARYALCVTLVMMVLFGCVGTVYGETEKPQWQDELREIESRIHTQLQELTQENQDLRDKLKFLRAQVTQVETDKNKLQNTISSLEEEKNKLDNRLALLKDEYETAIGTIDSQRAQLNQSQTTANELATTLSKKEIRINDLSSQFHSLRQKKKNCGIR